MIHTTSTKKEETVEELETRKALLLSEITNLGVKKEELDTLVSNHEAHTNQYTDLTQDIEDKKVIAKLLEDSIRALVSQKAVLLSETDVLNNKITEKTALVSDIEKLKGILKVLQTEERESRHRSEDIHKKSKDQVKDAHEKLSFLHATIGSLISQIK